MCPGHAVAQAVDARAAGGAQMGAQSARARPWRSGGGAGKGRERGRPHAGGARGNRATTTERE
jgi:hypothetical protein